MKVIAIRVDIAKHIGSGHLQRSLTLAAELKQKGYRCIFFVRDYLDSYLTQLTGKHEYYIIGKARINKCSNTTLKEQNWLTVSEREDAYNFIECLRHNNISPDMIIIDHYSISKEWETIVYQEFPCLITVIDDLANRPHSCHLLIDQNYYHNYELRYENLISKETKLLLGPSYTILRPIFKKLRLKNNLNQKKQILVNFGGLGNRTLWNKIIPSLTKTSSLFQYIVVTGKFSNSNDFLAIQSKLKKSNILCLESTNNMAQLMAGSSFALGACGTTVWERFSLGLNAALIDIAPNQTELIQYLHQKNLIDYLGSIKDLTEENLTIYLKKLELDSSLLKVRKERIMALIDGLGTERIVQEIERTINKGPQ